MKKTTLFLSLYFLSPFNLLAQEATVCKKTIFYGTIFDPCHQELILPDIREALFLEGHSLTLEDIRYIQAAVQYAAKEGSCKYCQYIDLSTPSIITFHNKDDADKKFDNIKQRM